MCKFSGNLREDSYHTIVGPNIRDMANNARRRHTQGVSVQQQLPPPQVPTAEQAAPPHSDVQQAQELPELHANRGELQGGYAFGSRLDYRNLVVTESRS
jgi:hypothetical protein